MEHRLNFGLAILLITSCAVSLHAMDDAATATKKRSASSEDLEQTKKQHNKNDENNVRDDEEVNTARSEFAAMTSITINTISTVAVATSNNAAFQSVDKTVSSGKRLEAPLQRDETATALGTGDYWCGGGLGDFSTSAAAMDEKPFTLDDLFPGQYKYNN
jgi:hypothetical protein